MAWISNARLNALDRRFRTSTPVEVADYQLERVNAEWDKAVRRIPYYAALAEERRLPRRFGSLQEFIDAVPPLTRDVLQRPDVRYWHAHPRPNRRRTTGGTTATPVQMPTWRREFQYTALDPWLARRWWGITPRDRLFLYWGHAHLLGSGWRGRLNAWLRGAKDRVQNYVRHSAYDMSEQALRDGLAHLAQARPGFVIGYSRYLDELARRAAHWRAPGSLDLKAVIAAAEALPALDSRTRIQDLFEAPLAMEYGAVETGLMAHSHPEGGYRVFWHSYLLECRGTGAQEVFATSLFPRCTPLFRYRLGDRFELGGYAATTAGCSVLAFAQVLGRSNAPVVLPSGRTLHSESVSHIVRDQPKVLAYQFACAPDRVTLRLKLKAPLTDAEVALVRHVAKGIDRELAESLRIVPVSQLERTVAGKTPMVVMERSTGG